MAAAEGSGCSPPHPWRRFFQVKTRSVFLFFVISITLIAKFDHWCKCSRITKSLGIALIQERSKKGKQIKRKANVSEFKESIAYQMQTLTNININLHIKLCIDSTKRNCGYPDNHSMEEHEVMKIAPLRFDNHLAVTVLTAISSIPHPCRFWGKPS